MTDHQTELAAFSWLNSLPRGAYKWLARSLEDVGFDAGEQLIVQGATDRDCYFLVGGTVEVAMNGQVVGRVGAGEVEGEMALLYRRPRGGTATAVEAVRALRLNAEDFDALAREDLDSARSIAEAIIVRLAERFGWRPPDWTPLDDGGVPSADKPTTGVLTPDDFVHRYERALATQDWSVVDPLIHEKACVTFSTGTVHVGKSAVRRAFEENFSTIADEEYLISNIHWVHRGEDMAIYLFDFDWSGVIDDRPAQGGGRATCVLKREDGPGWRLLVEHLGPAVR